MKMLTEAEYNSLVARAEIGKAAAKPLGEPVVLTICCDCRPAQHNLLSMCEYRQERSDG